MFVVAIKKSGKPTLINLSNVKSFDEDAFLDGGDGDTLVTKYYVNMVDGHAIELSKDSYAWVVQSIKEGQLAEAAHRDALLQKVTALESALSEAVIRLEEIRDNVGYFLAKKS